MARVSRAQVKRIAPAGQAAAAGRVSDLRQYVPTDAFLMILNTKIPDMSGESAQSIAE